MPMHAELFLVYLATVFAAALAATRWIAGVLQSRRILDIPNQRSSHVAPTPRGGGIAVVGCAVLGWIAAGLFLDALDRASLVAIVMALGLAGLSFVDDMRNLPAVTRLVAQAAAVAAGLAALAPAGGLFAAWLPFWPDMVVTGFLWLWFVNLFNFMDGIDGISGVETLSVTLGISGLVLLGFARFELLLPAATLAVAAAGFLVWNWHPARIFLGDVGSVPIGYLLGWLMLDAMLSAQGPAEVLAVCLLPAYYVSDATYTLLKRLFRGENVLQAHREHFYQVATRRGFTHAEVCRAIIVANSILVSVAWFLAPAWPLAAAASGGLVVLALLLWLRFAPASPPIAAD